MDAEEFNDIFDSVVAPAFTEIGGFQRGRRLFLTNEVWTVALMRTETRYVPPPKLTLCIRHNAMKNFDGEHPKHPPTNPSEYPIKLAPSAAATLVENTWTYTPYNAGRFPADTINGSSPQIVAKLNKIRRALDEALPTLASSLTPHLLISRIQLSGEDPWCERQWIEDLKLVDPLD